MINFQQMYDELCLRGKELYLKEGTKLYKPIWTWMNHHIIPICKSTDGELAKFTYPEHVKAHLLLCLLNPNSYELHCAFHRIYFSKRYIKFERNKIIDQFTLKYLDKVLKRKNELHSEAFSGENNPRHGIKCSKESRQKMSNAKIKSGSSKRPLKISSRKLIQEKIIERYKDPKNNANAKIWKLISPTGEIYEAHGNLEEKCKELNLSMKILKKYIGQKVPKIKIRKSNIYEINVNTINWKLINNLK